MDTLTRTAGGSRQHKRARVTTRVTERGQVGDKKIEADMSQWQWVQYWLHHTRNTGQLLPIGRQQACQ